MTDKKDSHPEKVNPVVHDPDITGAGFAEQLRIRMNLSGDPEDRLIVELAREVDRLDDLMEHFKPSEKAKSSTRRIAALKRLYDTIQDRKSRKSRENEVALIAMFLRKLKETMTDIGLDTDTKDTIVRTLATKIAEEAEKKDEGPRK